MPIHILNGDALGNQLTIFSSSVIIMRECLMEGPVGGTKEFNFWQERSIYLDKYNIDLKQPYDTYVRSEIEKIKDIPEPIEICLWFEFDVYCQVNMWFIINYIHSTLTNRNISWVFPNHREWTGFGRMDSPALELSFQQRRKLLPSEQNNFCQLWKWHVLKAHHKMKHLELFLHPFFKQLIPTIEALTDLHNDESNNRVTAYLRQILAEKPDIAFGNLFRQFSSDHGIYGLGDLQLKCYYDILHDNKQIPL